MRTVAFHALASPRFRAQGPVRKDTAKPSAPTASRLPETERPGFAAAFHAVPGLHFEGRNRGGKKGQISPIHVVDIPIGSNNKIQHHTMPFREPKTQLALVHYVDENFPNGAPIEIYAGSDGADAAAIGMLLMNQMGPRAAERYPIEISDLFPETLERLREGVVGCAPFKEEETSWKALMTQWDEARKHGAQGPLSQYLDPRPLDAADYPNLLIRNAELTELAANRKDVHDWWAKHADQENLYAIQPGVWNRLQRMLRIHPEPVDGVEALCRPPEKSQAQKPRVIVFRNAMYLLGEAKRKELLAAFRDLLPPGSVVVFGESEFVKYGYENYGFHGGVFKKQLAKAGLEPIADGSHIYVKR